MFVYNFTQIFSRFSSRSVSNPRINLCGSRFHRWLFADRPRLYSLAMQGKLLLTFSWNNLNCRISTAIINSIYSEFYTAQPGFLWAIGNAATSRWLFAHSKRANCQSTVSSLYRFKFNLKILNSGPLLYICWQVSERYFCCESRFWHSSWFKISLLQEEASLWGLNVHTKTMKTGTVHQRLCWQTSEIQIHWS